MKNLMMLLALFTVVHPGPLAAQSADALTDGQRAAIKRAQVLGEEQASPIALRLSGIVKQIYLNQLADTPDVALKTTLDGEMKELVWQLLLLKGESMWAAVRVLRPEQRATIREQVAKGTAGSDLPDLMDVIAHTFHLVEKR